MGENIMANNGKLFSIIRHERQLELLAHKQIIEEKEKVLTFPNIFCTFLMFPTFDEKIANFLKSLN